jgi:hypothetical protein
VNDIYKGPDPIPLSLPDATITITPSAFNFDVARTCLFMIDCVYGGQTHPPDSIQKQAEFRSKHDSTSVSGEVYSYQGILWVAIRGTSSLYDVVRDSETNQKQPSWPLNTEANNQFLSTSESSSITELQIPLVHEGFHSLYTELRDQIIDWVASVKDDSTIVLTGHSMGAGMALLIASDQVFAKFNLNNNVVVYTFGCPRVGNQPFVQILQNCKLHCYRVANSDDIFTTTPLSITIRPFHPSKPYLYEHYGVPIIFNLNRFSFMNNHSIYWYFDALSKPFSFQIFKNHVKDKMNQINEYCGFYDNSV